jgi:hypothetical protein
MNSPNYEPDYYDMPDDEEMTLAEAMQQEAEWQDYYEAYLSNQEPV